MVSRMLGLHWLALIERPAATTSGRNQNLDIILSSPQHNPIKNFGAKCPYSGQKPSDPHHATPWQPDEGRGDEHGGLGGSEGSWLGRRKGRLFLTLSGLRNPLMRDVGLSEERGTLGLGGVWVLDV